MSSPNPGNIPPVPPVSHPEPQLQPVIAHPAPQQPIYYPPPNIVIQNGGRSTFQRIFSWLGWTAFSLCFMLLIGQYMTLGDYFNTTEDIREKFHSGEKFSSEKIAIISIEGVMMSGEGFVKHQIDRIREDENIKGIVIRVDSPGGTVTSADYMYHHLKKLKDERKLPVVVSMGSVAASGGYYVSMAVGSTEKTIFAEPTTTTGSIGVMIPHYDVSGLMEKLDVKDDSLATHPRKLMLSMTKPITDDHRSLITGYLDESLTRFKEIIKAGRPAFGKEPSKLDELATGEIFSATLAKKHGLVDEIGFIEEAIERVCELAGVSSKSVRVVHYERPPTLFDFGGTVRAPSMQSQVSQIQEVLGTPRAYYMLTSFPPMMSTYRSAD